MRELGKREFREGGYEVSIRFYAGEWGPEIQGAISTLGNLNPLVSFKVDRQSPGSEAYCEVTFPAPIRNHKAVIAAHASVLASQYALQYQDLMNDLAGGQFEDLVLMAIKQERSTSLMELLWLTPDNLSEPEVSVVTEQVILNGYVFGLPRNSMITPLSVEELRAEPLHGLVQLLRRHPEYDPEDGLRDTMKRVLRRYGYLL